MLLIGVTLCLYLPWKEMWVNFEGYKLYAPVEYGFPWAPPPAAFPTPRTIDFLRLTEECGVAVVFGALVYWLL